MSTLNIGIRRTVFQLPTTIPFSYTYHSNIAHINITNYFFTVLVYIYYNYYQISIKFNLPATIKPKHSHSSFNSFPHQEWNLFPVL